MCARHRPVLYLPETIKIVRLRFSESLLRFRQQPLFGATLFARHEPLPEVLMSALDILTGCATFLLLLPVAFAQSAASSPSDREKDGLIDAVKTSVTETPFEHKGHTTITTETI